MFNGPTTVSQDSFQKAWKDVMLHLSQNGWALYNLVVQIRDPTILDVHFHAGIVDFCSAHNLLSPKQVAYTIFPHRLYAYSNSASELYRAYNRRRGLYERLRSHEGISWGTYFRRMTHYGTCDNPINQLDNIIQAIRARRRVHCAAYTVQILKPGAETIRPRGAPCLNYLAIQFEHTQPQPTLGMLCVYRNHNFLARAYGNYWGLCNLALFLCRETDSVPGPVTCVSSHAYVDKLKAQIPHLLSSL